jgi:predicted DNA repair protein MutK
MNDIMDFISHVFFFIIGAAIATFHMKTLIRVSVAALVIPLIVLGIIVALIKRGLHAGSLILEDFGRWLLTSRSGNG